MKIYLAGPFFSPEQLYFVQKIEEQLDENKIDYFSPRSEGILIEMTEEERKSKMVDIFESNISNMINSQVMIAIIDGFDIGTMVEIGYYYGLKKPIFTITDNDYGLNIMLRQMSDVHNKNIENMVTNILEYKNDFEVTIFDKLTKDVT